MGKQTRKLRGVQGRNFELSEEIDDHSLPSASEIIQYKEADPLLPEFIRNTATNEQLHRHKMNEEGMKLSHKEQWFQHGLNYIGLTFAFIITLVFLYFSYKIILLGMKTEGTVFAAVDLCLMLYLFIARTKKMPKVNQQ